MPATASMRSILLLGCVVAAVAIALAIGGCTGPAASRAGGSVPVAHEAAQRALTPAAATTPLGLALMHSLGAGNLVLSPDSIAAALAMAGDGAAGRTALQMAEVLHLSSPRAFAAVGRLQGAIAKEQLAAGRSDPQAATLELANGLFLQQGFALKPTFLAGLEANFGAAPQTVDFEGAGAVEAINAWVNAHTQGIIPSILSELPKQTRLALANAIYLKAAWRYPFKPQATAPAQFHGAHGSSSIAFMHETAELLYGHGHGYAAVDLPYRASTLSLLVLLPVGESVAALEGALGRGRLAAIAHGLSSEPVQLSLPRFHLATHALLNGPLKALGMPIAFGEAANFSGITDAVRLRIGLVEHASDFKVDEAGTVAAAATVVTLEPTVAHALLPRPIPFDANRPFLFFLRDDRTGALLFAGRLSDAASAQLPA